MFLFFSDFLTAGLLVQGTSKAWLGTFGELAKQIDLDSCFQSVSNGKSLIASAITGKGVSTASDATFQTMANNIGSIATGMEVEIIKVTNGATSASFTLSRVTTIIGVASSINSDRCVAFIKTASSNRGWYYGGHQEGCAIENPVIVSAGTISKGTGTYDLPTYPFAAMNIYLINNPKETAIF